MSRYCQPAVAMKKSDIFNEVEYRRAMRWLSGYCKQHNATGSSPRRLLCNSDAPCIMLAELMRQEDSGQVTSSVYKLKLCLDGNAWHIFYPGNDGSWKSYPNLPEASEWQRVVQELEQAPLHVHWQR